MNMFCFVTVIGIFVLNVANSQNIGREFPSSSSSSSSSGNIIGIKSCTGTKGGPSFLPLVSVEGCEKTPCLLKKGSQVHLSYQFKSPRNTPKVYNIFVGALSVGQVPFKSFNEKDGCQYLKDNQNPRLTGCPVIRGHNYTFTAVVPIDKTYPSVSVAAEVGLYDATKKIPLVCFSIPLKLAN